MDDKEDPQAGSTGNSELKLTVKQGRFAAAYADPNVANGNGTLAAKIAGYKGGQRQLAVQASSNLRNPKVRHAIVEAMDTHGCTLEHAALAVADGLQAMKRRCFLDKQGNVVYAEADPDHRIRLEASKLVFDLRSKCSAVFPEDEGVEELADNSARDAGQLAPEDHFLFERVTEIDAELAKLDELNGGGDRGTEQ